MTLNFALFIYSTNYGGFFFWSVSPSRRVRAALGSWFPSRFTSF